MKALIKKSISPGAACPGVEGARTGASIQLAAVLYIFALLGLASFAPVLRADDAPAGDAKPHIDLTKSPRIIAYQLRRMSSADLVALERHPDDAKYKPVYEALLVRKGIDRKYRQESADSLAKINKTDPVIELLDGIGKVDAEDKGIPRTRR
jgi:hypothetical protein